MAAYRAAGKKKLSLWQDLAPFQRELQKLPDTMIPKQIISDHLKALPGLVTTSPYMHSNLYTNMYLYIFSNNSQILGITHTHTHTHTHTQIL